MIKVTGDAFSPRLNRGESRHGVAKVIFHGQRGAVRKRYREGQEDQLGALGLVLNSVVLWNTLYMNRLLITLLLKEKFSVAMI